MSVEFCDIMSFELEEIIPNPTSKQREYWKKHFEGGQIDGSIEGYMDLCMEKLSYDLENMEEE